MESIEEQTRLAENIKEEVYTQFELNSLSLSLGSVDENLEKLIEKQKNTVLFDVSVIDKQVVDFYYSVKVPFKKMKSIHSTHSHSKSRNSQMKRTHSQFTCPTQMKSTTSFKLHSRQRSANLEKNDLHSYSLEQRKSVNSAVDSFICEFSRLQKEITDKLEVVHSVTNDFESKKHQFNRVLGEIINSSKSKIDLEEEKITEERHLKELQKAKTSFSKEKVKLVKEIDKLSSILTESKEKLLEVEKQNRFNVSRFSLDFKGNTSSKLKENYVTLSRKYNEVCLCIDSLKDELDAMENEKSQQCSKIGELEIELLKVKNVLDFKDLQIAEKDNQVREMENKCERNSELRNVKESMFILVSMLDLPEETMSSLEGKVEEGIRKCCLSIAEGVSGKIKRLEQNWRSECRKSKNALELLEKEVRRLFGEGNCLAVIKETKNRLDLLRESAGFVGCIEENLPEKVKNMLKEAALLREKESQIEDLKRELDCLTRKTKQSQDLPLQIENRQETIRNSKTVSKHEYLNRIKDNSNEFLTQWISFLSEIGETLDSVQFEKIYQDDLGIIANISKINIIAQFCVKFYHDNCMETSKEVDIRDNLLEILSQHCPESVKKDVSDKEITKILDCFISNQLEEHAKMKEKYATLVEMCTKEPEKQENQPTNTHVKMKPANELSFKDSCFGGDTLSKAESKYSLNFDNASFRVTEEKPVSQAEEWKEVVDNLSHEIIELKDKLVKKDSEINEIKLEYEDTFRDLIIKLLKEVRLSASIKEIFRLILKMLSFSEEDAIDIISSKGKGYSNVF